MVRLTAQQWKRIAPLMVDIRPKKIKDLSSIRHTIDGILWSIRSGCSWSDMPRRFPAPATCFKLYRDLYDSGRWDRILHLLAVDLKASGKVDILDYFKNGIFNTKHNHKRLYFLLDKLNPEKDWRWFTLFLFLNPYAESKKTEKNDVSTEKNGLKNNGKKKITFPSFDLKVRALYSDRIVAK